MFGVEYEYQAVTKYSVDISIIQYASILSTCVRKEDSFINSFFLGPALCCGKSLAL